MKRSDFSRASRARSAFTLVELLVVIAIIGLLIGLLLPAVQAAREAARRMQCSDHLKQLGLALQSHHDVTLRFPPGDVVSPVDPAASGRASWGWGTFILPYLEQQALYNQLKASSLELHDVLQDPQLRPVAQTVLPIYVCPSDPVQELNANRRFTNTEYGNLAVATASYVGVTGTRWGNAGNDPFGVLYVDGKIRLRDVTDGTSVTFLVGERSWVDLAAVWIGTRNYNGTGDVGLRQNLGIVDTKTNAGGASGTGAFSSKHPGGSQFLYVDGHVQFVSDAIDFNTAGSTAAGLPQTTQMGTFQRLARREDNLPISSPY